MAIYHCQAKSISRAAGRSATAAAAYRAGELIHDERTGEAHDYGKKRGIEYKEIITKDGSKISRSALWNCAENAEKRRDAKVAREWEIALPAELSPDQQRELARAFARELVARYGVAADLCVHAPSRGGDERNAHAHILTTTRVFDAGQLGAKTRVLDSPKTSGKEVEAVRQLWAALANRALERAGHGARIDSRSLAAQGIKRAPSVHLGPIATAMERRGVQTERGDLNRAAIAPSPERAELAALERMQAGISAARQQARTGWRKMQAAAAEAERRRQREKAEREREEAERQRQRQEAERRQKEAERQRQEASTLFDRYAREQGGTAEQQAAQVQRMLAAWEQQPPEARAAILAETRQRIEQQEQARAHQRDHHRAGPSLGR